MQRAANFIAWLFLQIHTGGFFILLYHFFQTDLKNRQFSKHPEAHDSRLKASFLTPWRRAICLSGVCVWNGAGGGGGGRLLISFSPHGKSPISTLDNKFPSHSLHTPSQCLSPSQTDMHNSHSRINILNYDILIDQ